MIIKDVTLERLKVTFSAVESQYQYMHVSFKVEGDDTVFSLSHTHPERLYILNVLRRYKNQDNITLFLETEDYLINYGPLGCQLVILNKDVPTVYYIRFPFRLLMNHIEACEPIILSSEDVSFIAQK